MKRNAEALNKYIQPHDPYLQTKFEMFSDNVKKQTLHNKS